VETLEPLFNKVGIKITEIYEITMKEIKGEQDLDKKQILSMLKVMAG